MKRMTKKEMADLKERLRPQPLPSDATSGDPQAHSYAFQVAIEAYVCRMSDEDLTQFRRELKSEKHSDDLQYDDIPLRAMVDGSQFWPVVVNELETRKRLKAALAKKN
jgi:hypothetical protein